MIRFKNAVKKYNKRNVLDNLSVDFEQGKSYALIAPNGHGKSTMMKTVCGIVKLDSGICTVDDKPVSKFTKSLVTYMPTEIYFYDAMSIEEIGKYYRDFYKDFDYEVYKKSIKFMELDLKMKTNKMSSGMLSKLKISTALSRKSPYIMLDEPLNGIDLIAREMVVESVISAISDEACVIISTHFFDEIEAITDTAVLIKEGQLAYQCELEDLRVTKSYSMSELYKEVYANSCFGDVIEEVTQ